jgi:ABC-type nitrate/sulfonate/bicarbonate transport system ATPase subunit
VTEPKIRIRGLRKTFAEPGKPPVEALAGIDLDVRAGEFVCVLGPSGCGKTTLLNMCGGFEGWDQGSVEIDGAVVAEPNPRRVFVFQEYGIFPWMSVWDNVVFGLAGASAERKREVAERLIRMVGLEGFETNFPRQLSGGMRQRVAVARALAVDPDVLFMDEPLGALDSLTRLGMRAEILRIWQKVGMTVLFVTHDVDEAIQLADRVVVMTPRPGRIAEIVEVGLAHPRDLGTLEYGRIRNRLYELLGVRHAV